MNRKKPNRECLQFQDEFLSTIRHQLGNSVNALKVTLDVLRENFDRFSDEKRKIYVIRGLDLLSRQEEMVDAMRAMILPALNYQDSIPFIPFWDYFKKLAFDRLNKEHILIKEDDDILPCNVLGHRIAMEQAMEHILDNAIEAVREVSLPRVEFKVLERNTHVIINVVDNGVGIEKKDLVKVFIPLFTTKPGSHGMGLAIAKRLLAEMGAELRLVSAAGRGTRITIRVRKAALEE